jgi:hypothetical protein
MDSQPAASAVRSPAVRAPNEALRAKWGLALPAQPAQPAQPSAAQDAGTAKPPAKSNKVDVTELVKEELPDLVIAAEQKTIRMLGRRPKDPEPKLEAKFQEALEKLSTDGLPKIELPPGWAALGLAGALWLQMFVGAEKTTPEPAKATAPPVATKPSAGDTAGTEVQQSLPPSSARTPTLSILPGGGDATNATPSASGD